jgi:hypothetical protein
MTRYVLLAIFFLPLWAQAQNVGIGVTTPLDKLHVDKDIRLGVGAWSSPLFNRYIKFGDGDFVTIGEVGLDDRLQFTAREFLFTGSTAYGANAGKVGINITGSPTAQLEVNGTVKITDGNQSEGKLLTSSADGTASWQYLSAANSGFHATVQNAAISIADATDVSVLFDTEEFDDGADFNTSNGEYTVPDNGVYQFNVKVAWRLDAATNTKLMVSLQQNGTTVEQSVQWVPTAVSNDLHTVSFGTTLRLGAGDIIRVRVRQESGVTHQVAIANSSFSGFRIY